MIILIKQEEILPEAEMTQPGSPGGDSVHSSIPEQRPLEVDMTVDTSTPPAVAQDVEPAPVAVRFYPPPPEGSDSDAAYPPGMVLYDAAGIEAAQRSAKGEMLRSASPPPYRARGEAYPGTPPARERSYSEVNSTQAEPPQTPRKLAEGIYLPPPRSPLPPGPPPVYQEPTISAVAGYVDGSSGMMPLPFSAQSLLASAGLSANLLDPNLIAELLNQHQQVLCSN